MRAALIAVALAATAAVSLPLAARHHGFVLNTTASGPKGLWQRAPDAPIERGRWVLFCLDPKHEFVRAFVSRGVCPNGLEYFLKPVVALPGDAVVIDRSGVTVNGSPIAGSAPLPADAAGNPLPRFAMNGPVDPGTAVVISTHSPQSIDSRYFGPIALADVVSVAVPVVVGR